MLLDDLLCEDHQEASEKNYYDIGTPEHEKTIIAINQRETFRYRTRRQEDNKYHFMHYCGPKYNKGGVKLL